MAKFWTCGYGANHDMGERCDCYREEEQKGKKMSMMLVQGLDGQMELGGLFDVNFSYTSSKRRI